MRISKLRSVFDHTGPFATAYLGATTPDADIARTLEVRWRALRSSLAEDGCTDDTLRAMEAAVFDERAGRRATEGVIAVGTAGECVFHDSLAGHGVADRCRFSAIPAFGPYVRSYGNAGLMALAVVDHTGADIITKGVKSHYERTVSGEEHPLHKVRGGGLSHRRIQASVDETRDRNAATIADELAELVAETSPSVLVLAGEVEARSRVHDHLPPAVRRVVSSTSQGGRAEGGRDELESALTSAGEAFESTNRNRLLEEFTSNLSSGRAVQGGRAVVDAVRRGEVEVLLLSEPASLSVLVGPRPLQLGWDRSDLEAFLQQGDRVEEDLLDSAVIRAGAATDVHTEALADAELEDGLGALLRFET